MLMPLSLAHSPDKNHQINAVIFDMDGLLLDTEILSFNSFVTTAARYDIAVALGDYQDMIGLNAATGINVLRSIIPVTIDAVAFKNEWLTVYRELLLGDITIKEGALAFLTTLQQLEIPRAVATSSSGPKARNILKKTGLMQYIDHVSGGDEVPSGKPAPDVYLDAAAKLGVNPINCLAFEDSNNGTTAALAAGMKVIQIPDLAPSNRLATPPQLHICKTLEEGASLIGLSLNSAVTSNYT